MEDKNNNEFAKDSGYTGLSDMLGLSDKFEGGGRELSEVDDSKSEIDDSKIVDDLVNNESDSTDLKGKVCNVCGKPAFVGNEKEKIYLCQSHYKKMLKYRKKQRKNVPIVNESPKIGRNEVCPCGSGLKYKKCCMNKKENANPDF